MRFFFIESNSNSVFDDTRNVALLCPVAPADRHYRVFSFYKRFSSLLKLQRFTSVVVLVKWINEKYMGDAEQIWNRKKKQLNFKRTKKKSHLINMRVSKIR